MSLCDRGRAETDLDLGHYERFIDEDLNKFSNLDRQSLCQHPGKGTAGRVLGSTVQYIPHVTDEIKRFIYRVGDKTGADVVITEIGGTTGDIESQIFLEAIRQVGLEAGRGNSLYIHVTQVPYLKASGEHKSKPTQHSVKELQGMGISPDIIVLRCDEPIEDESIFCKIAGFCNVKPECVIENLTTPVLYEVPLLLEKKGMSDIVCQKLNISAPPPDLAEWRAIIDKINNRTKQINIALVGKYVQLHDAYLSVAEALRHAGYEYGCRVEIKWVDSETVSPGSCGELFSDVDGILVPGGFGVRGIEGKICSVRYAREKRIPFLGICLGMQVAVIEFARNVLGWSDANSSEFDGKSAHRVIDFMPGQHGEINKGGTLRLGAYPCLIAPGTMMEACYGRDRSLIFERHRHRYELNNVHRAQLESAGLIVSGTSPDGRLVETVELGDHPFFVGVQYHPEFKSRPNRPHPLFSGFVGSALRGKWGSAPPPD